MRTITGVWDIQRFGAKLGALLCFQQELLLLKRIHCADSIEMHFVNWSDSTCSDYLLTTVQVNPHIKKLSFHHTSMDPGQIRGVLWPEPQILSRSSCSDSMLTVYDLWRVNQGLLPFQSPGNVQKRTKQFIHNVLGDQSYVAVHLKNNPQDKQSNATQAAWDRFFKHFPSQKFVLIGNEALNEAYFKGENVIITKNLGHDLALDLDLIFHSSLFMGMSSGPSVAAITTPLPYLIWKHPDHHVKEMEREFQGNEGFGFAGTDQRFLREWDTSENLTKAFIGIKQDTLEHGV